MKYFWIINPFWFIAQGTYYMGQQLDKARRSTNPQWAPLPTVCVGNFQAGGTGKTPATRWIANELAQKGYEPIILLRGYKGAAAQSQLVRSNDATLYGDEAVLHAKHFPTIVGKDRLASCQLALTVAKTEKPVLVLDDGLQHYELKKDFSIVCQKNKRFEKDWLLPFGRLREIPKPKMDAIITQFEESGEPVQSNWQGIPEYTFSRQITLISGTKEPGLIACGIALPNDFFYAVQKAGGFIGDEVAFSDHKRYSESDLKTLESRSKKYNYRLHCTAKDAVKLEPLIRKTQSPITLSVWDVQPQPISVVGALLDAMVSRIEEVYKNRPLKGSEKA